MNTNLRTIGITLLVAFAVYLAWYFSAIVAYILISAVLSIMGHPLVRFFDSLHIRKIKIPHALSTALALLLIIAVFSGLIFTFVPLIVSQANVFSKIDANLIAERLQGPVSYVQNQLVSMGLLRSDQTLEAVLIEKMKSLLSITTFSDVLSQFVNFTGSVFIGVSAVLFITFFFLKDERMFYNLIMLLVPVRYHPEANRILIESKRILTRYFLGVVLELIIMIALMSIGLTIFGIQNALLLGFFGGLMNIIPYIGPLIGIVISVLLGITTCISAGAFNDIAPVTIRILGVFIGANMIDGNLLQPFIFGNSVKAHPLEIFIVFIMAGTFAGIMGMVLAIPVYTVIRIIAREFFSNFRIVQKLTEKL
jgi:predicted PurR-regulated permease PerM